VFPLLVEALNGRRLSVGTPYFERMTLPIGLTLLFLMAIAPVLPWRKASGETLRTRLLWPAWAGTGAVALSVAIGARGFAPLLAFGLGGFAAGAASRQILLATRRQGWRGFVGRTNGGMIVHLGVVMIAVAFAASSSYSTQREVRLAPGESARIAGHTITYLGTTDTVDRASFKKKARLRVDGGQIYEPAIQRFRNASQQVGTPSVKSTITEDVYMAVLALPRSPGGKIQLRLLVEPLVIWLWIGGAVIVFGSLLAAFPGRRRNPIEPVSAPVSGGREGPTLPPPEPDRDLEPEPAGV